MVEANNNEQKMIPTGKIFTFGKAFWLSFLIGGPLVIGYMISKNYQVFREYKKAKEVMIISVLFFIIFFVLLILLPNAEYLKIAVPAFCGSLTGAYMKSNKGGGQGEKIKNHINSGGQLVGWGKSLVISILGLIITVGIIFSVSYSIEWYRNNTNEVRKDLINYSNKFKLLKLSEYEKSAVDKYNNVMGNNYIDDDTVYTALNEIILPNYEKLYTGLIEVQEEIKTDELKKIHAKMVSGVKNIKDAYLLLREIFEKQDIQKIELFNEMFNAGNILLNEYKNDFKQLCVENGIN